MRNRFRQRGFFLNPFRFAGTVQSGAFDLGGFASLTAVGASIGASAASAEGSSDFIVGSDQAAAGAFSATAESGLTLAGASIASSNVSATGESLATADATGASISCDAADFDGTNDYLNRGTFTGQVDTKKGILAFWVNPSNISASPFIFAGNKSGGNTVVYVEIVSNKIQMGLRGNDDSFKLIAETSLSVSNGTWYHFLAAWDLSASTVHLYMDGVDRKSVTTGPTNADIDIGGIIDWQVGALGAGSFLLDGGIAEFYWAPAQYLDVSVEANLRKFIDSSGNPVSLGATGSAPTGTDPMIYLHLDDGETANNFAINRAGAGNFTVAGSLTTFASSPSD